MAMVTQADIRRRIAVFQILRGQPYPGQRYRHGWIPVAGLPADSFTAADAEAFSYNPDDRSEAAVELYAMDRICLPINDRLRRNVDLGTADGPSVTDEDWERWGPEKPYDLDELVDEIDRAIDRGRTDRDVTLWRGVALTPEQADQFVVGATVTDDGFISASMNRESAEDFASLRSSAIDGAEPYVFELLVPRGTPAAPVGDTGVSLSEILLERQRPMRVVARDGNRITLEVPT